MDVDELWSASPVNESSNISEDLDELLALEEDCSNETDAFNNTDDANVEDLGITTCPIPIIDDPSTIMITTTRPVTTTATATDDDEDCLDDHLRDHGDNNNKDVERSGHVSPIPIPPDESSLGVVVSVSAPPTPILPLPVVLVAPTTPSSATAATPTVATSTRIEFHATMTTPSALSPTTLLNALLETSTPSLVTPILLEDSSEPVSNNNNNNGCSSRFTAHHPPPPLPITHTGVDAVDLEDLVFSVASANNNPVAKKTAIEATEVTEFLVDHTANGGVLPVEVDEKMQGSTSSDGIEQNVTYVTDLLQSSSSSHEAQLLVSNNPLHLEDPMNDTTTDQHVDEEFMDSKEDMPSQLLPDILSQWSKNDPIGRIEASVPSLFSEMDESGIFLSPNKSMMETSFIDSTSSPQIESLNEQTQTRNWPRSATGLSDTVSSDDEAILSFVTAKEAYDGDESTIASSKNSRETSGTAPISTDQRIATSVSFEMIFPPENNTTDSRCADLLDPSTPKRSGRFFMDNNDGDNWQTSGDVNSRLTGALTTPDIAETLPLSAPLVSSGIEELAPNGEHSVEMDSAGSRLLPQSSGAQQETAKDKDSVLDRAEILADPLEVTVDCIASVATDQIDHKPMATQVALENGEVDGTPTSIIESLAPIASMTICGEMSATIASPSIEVLKIEHIVNDSKHERQVNFELAETFERILENAEDAIVNDHLEPGIILELRDECNGSYSRAKSHLENCLPLNSLNNDTILFASNPNGDHFQRSQEGPVSVSSLLSKNAIGSNQILEDLYSKGKVKTLQVEFPAALESGLKRSDVSLSSASSTISHGSFTRGMTNSGATSSYNAERLQQRKNSTTDSLPPRFPENVKQHSEHSSSFADSLSYMLLAAKDDSDEADAVETKWMKHSVSASFNPLKSIFAGKSGISVDNDISPPGSPPEPYYSDYDEELESLQGNSCGSSSAVVLVKEAMIWGIMPEDDLLVFQNNSSQTGEEPSGKKSLDPVDGTVLKAPIESTNQDTLHVDPFVLKRNAIRRELSITKSESGRRSASLDFKMRSISPVMTDGLRNEPTRLSRSPSMDRSPTPNIRCFRSSPDLRKLDDQLVEHILTPSKSVRDVQDTVKLSPEALVERFAKLSEHGPTESLLNSALLEEELLAFSSLRRIDMPFDVAHQQDHDELKYLGSVRWRQLVAYWKHSEMSTAMMKRSDPPGSNNCLRKGTEDDGGGSRSSSCRQRISTTADLVLNGVSNDTAELPFLNTMKGFTSPQKEFTLSSISRFLSDIGCIHADSSSRACRHELSLPNQPILEDIVRSAEANVPTLSLLIQEIVTFSSSNSTELGSARSSIGVKKAEDIERKANYKYGGNIMLVKDVLRAQITFMEEGGLVCGLICLLRMTRLLETARDDTCHGPIELVRVKNLFFNKFQIGAVSASSLPTGYRHMLLNVRMIDGLIAGKRCVSSCLFEH